MKQCEYPGTKLSRHFFFFNDYHLFDNAIFSSDILPCVAYGDVCKKANISFVGKYFIVKVTFNIRRRRQ